MEYSFSAKTVSEGWVSDFLKALGPFTEILWSMMSRAYPFQGMIFRCFHCFKRPSRTFAAYRPVFRSSPAKLVCTSLRSQSGCSGLPIDTRRLYSVLRLARVCSSCHTGSPCKEQHRVFECPALTTQRLSPHSVNRDIANIPLAERTWLALLSLYWLYSTCAQIQLAWWCLINCDVRLNRKLLTLTYAS